MKSNIARRVSLVLVTVLTSTLTLAQAAGAKDFGQRSVRGPEATAQPQGGAKDFGQ